MTEALLKQQNKIIADGNAPKCCDFASTVPGADIVALQEAVINAKDAQYIYKFALVVPGADILALSDALAYAYGDIYKEAFAQDRYLQSQLKMKKAV